MALVLPELLRFRSDRVFFRLIRLLEGRQGDQLQTVLVQHLLRYYSPLLTGLRIGCVWGVFLVDFIALGLSHASKYLTWVFGWVDGQRVS